MATANALSKQYLERPFEYALQKAVMIVSIAYLVHASNNYLFQPGAPSMVRDALRRMEEEGISSKGFFVEQLKEAAGSAFLGTLLGCLARSLPHARNPTCQLHQRPYVAPRLNDNHRR